MAGDVENQGNSPSPHSPSSGLKSSVKSSRKCLGAIDFSLLDPTSPTKGSKSSESVFPVFDLSLEDAAPTYNDEVVAAGSAASCPELLPIDYQMDDGISTASSDSDSSLLSVTTPDTSDAEDDDSVHNDENDIPEPTSPSMKRLNSARNPPTKNTPTASLPPRAPSASILEESLLLNATPHRNPRASIMPLFDTQPLFVKRPVPVIPTPSRIPRPMERTAPSTAAPGIRMPGQFHLTYDRPSNFVELSHAPSSSGNTTDNSIPMRLDGHLDITPKCSVYLSSPYPRLTKQANHTVRHYEQRLAEMKNDSQHSLPTPRQVARSKILESTPKKLPAGGRTPPRTVEGGKRVSNRTIPISPKLATAARTRKCQCCEGGVHGPAHKHSKAQPHTTVGKRATTLRRRPDAASGTPSRFMTPASKTMRNTKSRPATMRKAAATTEDRHVKENASVHPSMPATTTPAKPKLNLTTSLPEFKQPLAAIAPTPQKTRQEIEDRLRTPLPQPTPQTPNTSNAAVNSRLAALEASQTPSKLKTLDEILGPNYHLVRSFNVKNPLSNTPLETSLLD